MSSSPPLSRYGAARTLLLLCGVLFLAGAVIHNPGCVSLAVRTAGSTLHRPVAIPPTERIHDMQWLFAAAGALILGIAWLIGRVPALDRGFRRPAIEKLTLVLIVFLVPIVWGELGLRAFVPPRDANTTSIFVRDDELGWKLRPGAADRWGGVEVRINERGYRGPLVPVERAPGTRRVLYLGDSVTFGYRVARWEDTFPFLADSLLAARDSLPVETVNLAVEGYSQWQQAILMANEGARYRPDLVVLGFVLNDVTEMFHLTRFGGAEEGFQMRHAASSWIDRVLDRSAIAYQVRNITREIKAKRKLGEDVRLGAIKQQALDVETLMRKPDQANVKTAWDFALADLQKIADRCAATQTPLLVVAFPFAVQLENPLELNAPQRVLEHYTRARGITFYDLLPPLAQAARADTTALFLDEDHLSPHGHRAVARLLAPVLSDQLDSR